MYSLISFSYILFLVSDDQPLPLLEHDELDSLQNGIDWDQPLSPLDLNSPTDTDINTLLFSSSPISPVALRNQPPNPLVDKFLHSLKNNPIQSTDHPATSRQESRFNIVLPSLFASKAYSNKTQSEESQSNPSSPRRIRSKSAALRTSTQDARASLSRPNQLQRKQQSSKQKRRGSRYQRFKSVRRPRYNPYLHYQLTNAFSFWEVLFWEYKRQEYTIQNTASSSQRLLVPLTAIEVQPIEWHWIHTHPFSSRQTVHDYSQYIALNCWQMDASASQEIIDLTIPSKCPKTSPDSNSPTVSEQLHLLTTQDNQHRINSEQALKQTKPLIQTFPLANIN